LIRRIKMTNYKNGQKITQEEADKLTEEGIAAFFDIECHCGVESEFNCKNCDGYQGFGGFFEAPENAKHPNIILVITDKGNFIRAREDLVKSEDEIFVGWVEQGDKPPNFEDVCEVREL